MIAKEVEQGQYSHKSEMYSIGASLYAMLCGENHFSYDQGETAAARTCPLSL